MAVVHKCDRCRIEIVGHVVTVKYCRLLNKFSNAVDPENKEQEFEICSECTNELRRFVEGCAITESYRQYPRGAVRPVGVE